MPITFACSCLCFRASCRSNGSRVLSASALALLLSRWASASREHSYRCSVVCSRSFRSAWRFCCLSNSACCDLSKSAQAFSQLGVLFTICCYGDVMWGVEAGVDVCHQLLGQGTGVAEDAIKEPGRSRTATGPPSTAKLPWSSAGCWGGRHVRIFWAGPHLWSDFW